MRIITDENYHDAERYYGVLPRYIKYGTVEARAIGLNPIHEQPDKLVPEDEWKERIEEANAHQMFPVHYFEQFNVTPKDQNGYNYCWGFALASVCEAVRLLEGQEYIALSGTGLGELVKWRNVGNWLSSAIEGASTLGVPSRAVAPETTINPRNFKDNWKEDRKNYRLLEWFDTIGPGSRNQDEEEHVAQCVSLLLSSSPGFVAYNWWGHAVMAAGLVWDARERHNLRWVIWNSWNDGRLELIGRKGVPDEFYAPRVMVYATLE